MASHSLDGKRARSPGGPVIGDEAWGRLPGFRRADLPGGFAFWTGALPGPPPDAIAFEALWALHPAEFPEIQIHGRRVKIPRWQQAYGVDYHFSGQVSRAAPIPAQLAPLLEWCRAAIDPGLNGLLLNWYDGRLGHYIGAHRDSIRSLAPGSPIVTVSFGEERRFRLRRWPKRVGGESVDFTTSDGGVFIMPWATNRAFTHEITPSKRASGRRVSVTIRAFV